MSQPHNQDQVSKRARIISALQYLCWNCQSKEMKTIVEISLNLSRPFAQAEPEGLDIFDEESQIQMLSFLRWGT